MSKKEEANDPLAGGREIKPNTVAFGKPGNWVKGVYTGKKTIQTANGPSTLYELKGLAGEYNPTENDMDDNGNKVTKVLPAVTVVEGDYYNVWGGKQTIDDGFRKVKYGTIVAVQFTEAKKSKVAGHSAFKIFRFVEYGMDPNYAGDSSEGSEVKLGFDDEDKGPF